MSQEGVEAFHEPVLCYQFGSEHHRHHQVEALAGQLGLSVIQSLDA